MVGEGGESEGGGGYGKREVGGIRLETAQLLDVDREQGKPNRRGIFVQSSYCEMDRCLLMALPFSSSLPSSSFTSIFIHALTLLIFVETEAVNKA